MRTLLITFALMAGMLVQAQNDDIRELPPERKQEIKAQKVAFITQRLALTPEEAQVFWPIYNGYEQELEEVRATIGKNRREARDMEKMTEENAQRLLNAEMESERKEMDIRQRYIGRIKDAVGARKALSLGRAEREFTREIFKRMRERGGASQRRR